MNSSDAVLALHHSTRHGERPTHPERLQPFQPRDESNRPAPLKTYPGINPVPLPRDLRRSSRPAIEVLSGVSARPAAERKPAPLDEGLLGTLLFLTAGVTRFARTAGGDATWFRTAMSAGNLHPVEVYVVGEDVHHYDPLAHALVPLRPGAHVCDDISLVFTGIPHRTSWKYGERGWRHLWWDAGTMLANLLAVADAHHLPVQVMAGFPDDDIAALVGIDGVDEVPLAVVRFGPGDLNLPPADALEPLTVAAEPVAPNPLRFPLVAEAQAETALTAEEVIGWRQSATAASQPAPVGVDPPAEVDAKDRIENVILRRGSTRMFRPGTAPTDLLGWALGAAARATPLDAAPAGTLLQHLISVHDVEGDAAGTEPGRYLYTLSEGFHDHIADTDAAAEGAHLCLDQPLGGDSAYTAFHAAALNQIIAAMGGRGYRAAHLEAGIAAGRLALNATALGAGATGLTFYDGLVSRHFATELAPLLATAVGIPATSPARSGTPGVPVELRGYGRVMTRFARRLQGR